MKRMVSKIFCVIMALCVFLGAMPVMSFAENDFDNKKIGVVENVELIKYSPGTDLDFPQKDNTAGTTVNKFYGDLSSTADTPYLFYSQLDDIQKKVYDTFLETEIGASFILNTNRSYTGVAATEDEAIAAAELLATNDIAAGLSAATEDYPMYFWVNSFGYNYYYSGPTYDGENYTYIITGLYTVSVSYDANSYSSYDDVIDKHSQLAEKVAETPVNGITRYEKVKSIHDYICEINAYPDVQGYFSDGTPWYGAMAHHPTGVFLKGLAVCEGYAEAFKLLCDREGIPCITVLGTGSGGAHKWNYVKMEDGKWYLVDATWNDQGDIVFNDYLLSGADTMTPHFEPSATDKTIHIPQGQMYSGVSFALQYPTLSDDAYGMIMLNYNVGDITLEDSMNVIFVGKDITTVQNSFTLPSDFSASITSFTDLTGGKLTVTKTATGTSKTYIVAKRGDIDGSNTTNTTDYTKVVTASSAGSCPTKNTAEFYAGDINHDGAIDGFDAIALDLYLEDTLKFD